MKLEDILSQGHECHASEVFIAPEAPVFFRIDGSLKLAQKVPVLSAGEIEAMIQPVLDEKQNRSLVSHGCVEFIYYFSHLNVKCRLTIVSQINGLAITIRYISSEIPTLDKIGAPDILKSLVELPYGLIIISGPEGSGKTTTVASLIKYINSELHKHVITLENNIEYVFKSENSLINQRQIGRSTQSVLELLRISLNSKPDILVFGEIQNRETMRMVLNTAETGHLVIAALNSSSVGNAVRRIIDFFPGSEKEIIRNSLAGIFQAVISQKLIKKIEGGRFALFEVLLATTAARNQIRENKIESLENLMDLNQEMGMNSFRSALEKRKQEIQSEILDDFSIPG